MVKKSTPKKTASKSSAKTSAAEAVVEKPAAATPEASVEKTTKPAASSDAPEISQVINKRAMLGRVAERLDMRPNKVREIYEAVLAELGEALANEEVLNLPPLGKISVNRKIENENADIIVCKLRRKKELSAD